MCARMRLFRPRLVRCLPRFRLVSSTSSKVEEFVEEPEYVQELLKAPPNSSFSLASSLEKKPVTIGRSHRLSIEMLPDEATEDEVARSVQEIVGSAPVSVELYTTGKKQRNALVLLESEAALQGCR